MQKGKGKAAKTEDEAVEGGMEGREAYIHNERETGVIGKDGERQDNV